MASSAVTQATYAPKSVLCLRGVQKQSAAHGKSITVVKDKTSNLVVTPLQTPANALERCFIRACEYRNTT